MTQKAGKEILQNHDETKDEHEERKKERKQKGND